MPGNSQRRNRRKTGTKKGAVVGSGGQRRKGLEGKGPIPPAERRPAHKAAKNAEQRREANAKHARKPRVAPGKRSIARGGDELLVGRNPVYEALTAQIPARALYVAFGIEVDQRVKAAVAAAANQGLSIIDVSRSELDAMTGGVLHQGIALKVPPYNYAEYHDLLAEASNAKTPGLLVATDGVTDPRNLGAIVRSAAAFGANGVVIPQRRAAGVTATAWRTSAGAAARLPIARVTNLVRSISQAKDAGVFTVGLDADGETLLDELPVATDSLMLVIGSEGRGLSHLTTERVDFRVRIPMVNDTESLNASVAASVALAEIARQRRR